MSNLKQFFTFMYELIADRKFGICNTVVSVESTCCIPDFQHVQKFHIVFKGKEELPPLNDHGATVSERERSHSGSKCKISLLVGARNVSYVTEYPAPFALKRKFAHYLNV